MNDHLNPRSAGIDLLRCLSVLLVIFSHYGAINGFPLGGTHGVVIFFMVSGYCMFYSMKGRGGAEFIAARFWRLIPMLVICATITHSFEIFFYAIPDRSQSFKEYLGNVACLPTGNVACDIIYNFLNGRAINYKWVDGVYWSLLVEIRFYVVLWILYYFMKIKSPIIWISVLGFLSLLSLEWNGISKLNDFFMYMPFFSFGMASSLFFRKRKYGLVLMINSFLIFAVLSFVEVDSISMGLNKSNFFSYAFCFVIYLICMIAYRGKCSNILSYVGIISYPLYLLHQDIGLILIKMISAPSAWVGIASAVCIVFVLSVLVNAVVEQYQPKLRERFSIESFRPKRVV